MHIRRRWWIVGITCGALVAPTGIASATTLDPDAAEAALTALADVPVEFDRSTQVGQVDAGTYVSDTSAGTTSIDVPETGTPVVTLDTAGRSPLAVALPTTPTQDPELTQDGTVLLAGSSPTDVSIAVLPLSDGKVSVQTVIPARESEHRFTYDFQGDAAPQLRPDGGIDLVVKSDGVSMVVGTVDAPWAFDATGTSVPTEYVVAGSLVTQLVHASEANTYPIVADPTYGHTYGIPTVYLNRAETQQAAGDTGGVMIICGLVGLWNPVVGFLCAGNAYNINQGARYANDRGMCVKLLVAPGAVATQAFSKNCS